MKLDFSAIAEVVIPRFKGGEGNTCAKMYQDENGKIMCGALASGASIGTHTHETSSEIIYILRGAGKALCDGREERLSAGDCHYCPKGHTHSLCNNGEEPLEFLAVVPEQP